MNSVVGKLAALHIHIDRIAIHAALYRSTVQQLLALGRRRHSETQYDSAQWWSA